MVSIHIFGTTLSFKKDRTSSIFTFLNRLLKQFTGRGWGEGKKNRLLMRVKALHSMRTCLMEQSIWHDKHSDRCFCFSMKEWVSLVWPMWNQDIMTISLLDFLKPGFHSHKVGRIWKSSLWVLLFQCCCHFV